MLCIIDKLERGKKNLTSFLIEYYFTVTTIIRRISACDMIIFLFFFFFPQGDDMKLSKNLYVNKKVLRGFKYGSLFRRYLYSEYTRRVQ